jgi:hypothetical protein
MKQIPQFHFVHFPVTVLELVCYKNGTRTRDKSEQNRALAPSYTRWNCLLKSSLYRGIKP